MARSAAVSYEAVERAALELEKSGVAPTQQLIIEKVGGSFTTVGPLLRQWKVGRKAAKAANTEVPRHLEIDLAVDQVLRRAQAEAREELQGDIAGQLREIEGLTLERDGAQALVQELTLTNGNLKSERDELKGRVAELEQQVQVERAERVKTAATLEAAQNDLGLNAGRIASLDARVAGLVSSESELKGQVSALRHRVEQAEGGQAEAELEANRRVAELQAKLDVERKARTDAEERGRLLQQTVDSHGDDIRRLAAAEAVAGELRNALDVLRSALAAAEQNARAAIDMAAGKQAATGAEVKAGGDGSQAAGSKGKGAPSKP